MKKSFFRFGNLLLCLLMIGSLFLGVTPRARAAETDVLEARKSVVRIVTYVEFTNPNGAWFEGSASGFFVGEQGKPVSYVVTNRHAVDSQVILAGVKEEDKRLSNAKVKYIRVWVLVDGEVYEIDYSQNVILSQIADLAVLKLDSPVSGRAAAVLGDEDSVEPTDTIYAIGYPGIADVDDKNNTRSDTLNDYLTKTYTSKVDNLSVTKGSIVKTNVVSGGISHIQHDANISYGNSGGPLVLENGQVVGINTMSTTEGLDTANYSIDISNVITLLKQNNIPYTEGAAVKPTQAPTAAPTAKPTAAPATKAPATAAPATAAPAPAAEAKSGSSTGLIIGIAAAAVVIAAALVLGKKKTSKAVPETPSHTVPAAGVQKAEKTLRPMVRSCAEQHGNKKVSLGKDPILLGRTSDCKIVYKDGTPGVSGKHCAIAWDPERLVFIVKDLGSTYGTFLESGMKLEANKVYRVKPGDSIYLGEKANKIRLEVE